MKNNSDQTVQLRNAKEKIRSRTNVVYLTILIVFAGIIAYKLLFSNLTFDFSKFDFSDLLSLILAIFSISLAVIFYFKATETSNLFYDNTYKFTKDISEILGRIEAGFGERLKHIDDSYSGLINKFDRNTSPELDQKVEEVKKEFNTEKDKLEKEIKEKQTILENALKKAKIEESERFKIIEQLNRKEKEIEEKTSELQYLKNQLNHAEFIKKEANEFDRLPVDLIKILMEYIRSQNIDIKTLLEAPTSYIQKRIKIDPDLFTTYSLKLLIDHDICSSSGSLTNRGIDIIREIIRRYK
jgi:hypothetical protein